MKQEQERKVKGWMHDEMMGHGADLDSLIVYSLCYY
jgi:hypothetical protein